MSVRDSRRPFWKTKAKNLTKKLLKLIGIGRLRDAMTRAGNRMEKIEKTSAKCNRLLWQVKDQEPHKEGAT